MRHPPARPPHSSPATTREPSPDCILVLSFIERHLPWWQPRSLQAWLVSEWRPDRHTSCPRCSGHAGSFRFGRALMIRTWPRLLICDVARRSHLAREPRIGCDGPGDRVRRWSEKLPGSGLVGPLAVDHARPFFSTVDAGGLRQQPLSLELNFRDDRQRRTSTPAVSRAAMRLAVVLRSCVVRFPRPPSGDDNYHGP